MDARSRGGDVTSNKDTLANKELEKKSEKRLDNNNGAAQRGELYV